MSCICQVTQDEQPWQVNLSSMLIIAYHLFKHILFSNLTFEAAFALAMTSLTCSGASRSFNT